MSDQENTTDTTTTQSETVLETQPEKELSLFGKRVVTIFQNIEAGQQVKGKLTLRNVKSLRNARDTLLKFDDSEGYTTKEVREALAIYVEFCELLQSTGVYHTDGAIMLLDTLEALESSLDEREDPSSKFSKLKDRLQHKTKK